MMNMEEVDFTIWDFNDFNDKYDNLIISEPKTRQDYLNDIQMAKRLTWYAIEMFTMDMLNVIETKKVNAPDWKSDLDCNEFVGSSENIDENPIAQKNTIRLCKVYKREMGKMINKYDFGGFEIPDDDTLVLPEVVYQSILPFEKYVEQNLDWDKSVTMKTLTDNFGSVFDTSLSEYSKEVLESLKKL
jgi:hypothetical protein